MGMLSVLHNSKVCEFFFKILHLGANQPHQLSHSLRQADFWVSNRGIELDSFFFSILKTNSVVICTIQNSSPQLYACTTRKARLQVSAGSPVLKKNFSCISSIWSFACLQPIRCSAEVPCGCRNRSTGLTYLLKLGNACPYPCARTKTVIF